MRLFLKLKLFFVLIIFFLPYTKSLLAQKSPTNDCLVKVWEVNQGLDIPESVHFNKATNSLFVLNFVGRFDVKNGKRYISKLNTNGEFIQKDWVRGLNGPKGMGSTKTWLYVTDMDRVVKIDIKSGQILN